MPNHTSGELGLIVASVRALIRHAAVASLATLEAGSGDPYVSLITVATETNGSPVFLISQLAWHTRNLQSDSRASILLSETAASGDPLNLGRVSLMGTAAPIDDARARSRFLARHPTAALYAEFSDFGFWRLKIDRAHYVGGFGRITTLPGSGLLMDPESAAIWDSQADAAVAKANAEQAEDIRVAAGGVGGDCVWRIAACDPEGCDLICGEKTRRLIFDQSLVSPDDLPAALRALAARSKPPIT